MGETWEWRIGAWEFDAVGARLRHGEREVQLENRAARTLEMLCRHRGRPVSRDEILALVWEGRAVSANSVAIVIADLRRALGADASELEYIATVPKRGYRVSEELVRPACIDEPAPASYRMRPPLVIALVTAMLFLMAGLLVGNKWRVEPAPVLIENVSNDTGIATYQPLATALQELITDHLSASGMKVISPRLAADERGGKGFMRLRSRLIIWNGISTLSMQATDKMGVVAWAAMAVAPPDGLAAATISKLELFQQASRSRSRGPDSLRRR